MKPIKATLTPDQVIALEKAMNQLEDFRPQSIEEKVTMSVLMDIEDKIHSKYRSIIKSTDLFNTNKKVTLKLKYHEAFAIYGFIQIMIKRICKEEKAHNDLLMLSNFLNQKLA